MDATQFSTVAAAPVPNPGSLEGLYSTVCSAIRSPTDWQALAETVAARLRGSLPSGGDVRGAVPAEARNGTERSQLLYVEPGGSFSVVALLSRPGQATSIHDHTTWGVVAVIEGTEDEERFMLAENGRTLVRSGTRRDVVGTVNGFAPPGDIHLVTNSGPAVAISLHIYGTDISRIGSSVRRTYDDLPVIGPEQQMASTPSRRFR